MYIHIPFCKQACHYCDFHFSTSLKKKPALVEAICKEILLRKDEIMEPVRTIYFGGGTPSLLRKEELDRILETVYKHYMVTDDAEITLEANPDDLTQEKIEELADSKVNRLSIGVQSFFEQDLQVMNRAHTAVEARNAIVGASKFFDNISVDLIYGIPGMPLDRWKENLQRVVSMGIPHISSYALTVEPKTALKRMIETGAIAAVDEEVSREHYNELTAFLQTEGFDNYEFSNFGKPGYFSRNNTDYWFGRPYLGIGPSAHSFSKDTRKWNVSNNSLYVKTIERGEIPSESERLSVGDQYNEYVMTRLRTKWGISLAEVDKFFGSQYVTYLTKEMESLLKRGHLEKKGDQVKIPVDAKFFSDGIAATLFWVV